MASDWIWIYSNLPDVVVVIYRHSVTEANPCFAAGQPGCWFAFWWMRWARFTEHASVITPRHRIDLYVAVMRSRCKCRPVQCNATSYKTPLHSDTISIGRFFFFFFFCYSFGMNFQRRDVIYDDNLICARHDHKMRTWVIWIRNHDWWQTHHAHCIQTTEHSHPMHSVFANDLRFI